MTRGSLILFSFVLVAEVLNRLINKAIEVGLVEDIHVGLNAVGISHLQLADDTLLFTPTENEILMNLKGILDCFGLMFGLRINYEKSAFIPLNCDDSLI